MNCCPINTDICYYQGGSSPPGVPLGYGRMSHLTARRLENTPRYCLTQDKEEISLMNRPEELTDPKKFDEVMEKINTKLAISAIPLRERALMAQALLGDELDYEIADDDSVYPLTLEWYRKTFPGENI